MKKILLVVAATLFASSAMSQIGEGSTFWMGGFKAGLSSNKLNINTSNPAFQTIPDKALGYNIGGMARLEFGLLPIFIQTELMYNRTTFKTPDRADIQLSTFNSPILFGFGLGNSRILKLKFNIGPVLNYTSSVTTLEGDWKVLESALSAPVFTWCVGFGFDILSITFDIRYNAQFSSKQATHNNIALSARPRSWTYTIGYLF